MDEVAAYNKQLLKSHNNATANTGNNSNNNKSTMNLNSSNNNINTSQHNIFSPEEDPTPLLLPIHNTLFEQHRLHSITGLLSLILRSELKFHCSVVEELSSALESLGEFEKLEKQQQQQR